MELYKTEQDLYEYFRNILTYDNRTKADITKFQQGVFVTSRLRKAILTGPHQGTTTLLSQHCTYQFINRGDGIYQVSPNYDFDR